jgi:hypothetical protein
VRISTVEFPGKKAAIMVSFIGFISDNCIRRGDGFYLMEA